MAPTHSSYVALPVRILCLTFLTDLIWCIYTSFFEPHNRQDLNKLECVTLFAQDPSSNFFAPGPLEFPNSNFCFKFDGMFNPTPSIDSRFGPNFLNVVRIVLNLYLRDKVSAHEALSNHMNLLRAE